MVNFGTNTAPPAFQGMPQLAAVCMAARFWFGQPDAAQSVRAGSSGREPTVRGIHHLPVRAAVTMGNPRACARPGNRFQRGDEAAR